MLDLGSLPLAGDFQDAPGRNQLYPLTIDACAVCGLLQVRDVVDPRILFGPAYSYASSTVPGLVRHFAQYAADVAPAAATSQRLLEVGCNDGVFLRPLRRVGYDVVGIDASDNVAAIARAQGLSVVTGFFNVDAAESLRTTYGVFDVVTCSNVFAHIPDIQDFLNAVNVVLDPRRGEFWVEVHSADRLFAELQWDCFYHEHCFYWTIRALVHCLSARGFRLNRYALTPMHGGGIRARFTRQAGTSAAIAEPELSPEDWLAFAVRCERSRQLVNECVLALGLRYAYGAAGRAVTLINWAGLGGLLDFAVDGSPLRYGKYIPNTNIRIVAEEEFLSRGEPGKFCFVTAHNYLAEIRKKVERAFPLSDTRFVTPLPDVRIQ